MKRSFRLKYLRKLRTVTVGALCSAFVLAACGGSGGGKSASDISWYFWVGSPGETAVWQHNADLVSKSYPKIKVNLSTTSWTDFWQKLPLEASNHSMQCIAGLQYGYVGSVGQDFIPLNTLIKENHYSLSPFTSTMIRELSVNGNLLALPYDFGPVVIAYNKTLFKAKGVPDPTDGWTWAQFLADAQKLTGGGDYGYLPGLSLELDYDLSGTPDAYLQNGKFNLTNSAFEQGIQQQAELTYKYHVAPTYSEAPNWATTEFDSGKIGMEVNGPWGLIDLKAESTMQIGWVEFPTGPDGMHTYNEGSGFGITKDCKDPAAAFKALTVLVDSQALSYAASTGRAFPARLADDHTWSTFAGEGAGPVMEAALKPAQQQEVTSNWTAFQTAFSKYEPLVLSGSISAAKFASEVQASAGSGTGVSPGNLTSLLGS
jgi:multiple sugar transport system substrate-binding protein